MKTTEKHILKDFNLVPTPEIGKVATGFDLDGLLKAKDEIGHVRILEHGVVNMIYTDLVHAVNNNLLEIGRQYKLTDFATTHRILDGNTVTTDYNTGVTEPLILTATSPNTFDKQVYSPLHPFDIIYYDITGGDTRDIAFFNDGTPIDNLKGVIYYRKDTIQNVECWYDFRNVKYRRWLVSATPWVAEGTYVANNVYEYDSILYKCIKDHTGLTDTPDVDTTNWIKWLDKTQNWSWTSETQFNIGNVSTTNLIMSDPIDVYTFGDYYKWVNNVEIGKIYLDYVIGNYDYSSKLNNIVFNTTDSLYTCFSNVFGENCFINTVGNNFVYNTVGHNFQNNTVGNNFYYNTVGNDFMNNTVGNNFYYNTVGNSFNDNTVGNSFNDNTVGNGFEYNNIGNNFNTNMVGNGFAYNTVGNNFTYNNIGNNFNTNIVGDGFNFNTVGNDFSNNKVENSFYNNTVGNSFSSNTVGSGFRYNKVGNNFYGNTIGNYFISNTIGKEFISNTIGNEFRYNDFKYSPTLVNFTTATHVYSDYNCEIIKNSAGVFRLKYIDGSDADVIVDITA